MNNNNRKIPHLTIPVKCGDCLFFTKAAHSYFGKPCSSLGNENFNAACSRYYPDFSHLVDTDVLPSVYEIAKIARSFNERQLRMLSFMFKNMASIFKSPTIRVKFGQPVFFNLSSPAQDYVECYYSGYVIGVSPCGTLVHIAGSVSDYAGVHIQLLPDSILTRKQWVAKRSALEAQGKDEVPRNLRSCLAKNRRKSAKRVVSLIDEIPTLDNVDPSWLLERPTPRKKRRNSQGVPDVVDVFQVS